MYQDITRLPVEIKVRLLLFTIYDMEIGMLEYLLYLFNREVFTVQSQLQ